MQKGLYAGAANRLARRRRGASKGGSGKPRVLLNQRGNGAARSGLSTKSWRLFRVVRQRKGGPMTVAASIPMTDRPSGKSFWQTGHTPTLLAAFLYFDVSFMVWVMLGPLAPIISTELGLDPAQKGLMVAVPTLAGAVLRIVNGLLGDRHAQPTDRHGRLARRLVVRDRQLRRDACNRRDPRLRWGELRGGAAARQQ